MTGRVEGTVTVISGLAGAAIGPNSVVDRGFVRRGGVKDREFSPIGAATLEHAPARLE